LVQLGKLVSLPSNSFFPLSFFQIKKLTFAGFGNIGGILATYSFLKDDAPKYTKGYAICVSFMCFTAVMCMIYAISIFLSNKKRSQMADDVSLTDDEKAELGVSFDSCPFPNLIRKCDSS